MAFEEKRAWIMIAVTVAAYSVYVAVVLGRAGQTPLAEVPYAGTLLWCVGAAIVGAIVLYIAAAIASPADADRKDQRDREIHRFGEYTGQWFVLAGAIAALAMAMLRVDQFWIANGIYLAFVLSSLLASVVKIVSYRRGFQSW
ncbi:hypothetical protein [Catellatospora sp. TT07R-123]|uniref:hypothetical protein n=1 Tax=Catellatospora sp. TT07R-123 TaxID=2733863 RepID=UPI001BB457B1|nr:hypothetical protein [Catellatospora sp. TT07R-123]